jgi:pyridinium-3,5-bisthiocarboxylic acid mononucleotide nickel chelatase
MHIQLNPLGGVAGDMFIAAVLDAYPEHADGVLTSIAATGIPPACDVALSEHRDHILRGKKFVATGTDEHAPGAHDHNHQPFRDIVRRLDGAPLDRGIRERALAIFALLARAEGEVHGIPADDVTFHEVGAWDSIADIVGAAHLLEQLNFDTWSIGPLPLGTGRIATAHGTMPVPAPATAALLKGFMLFDDGIPGERVTPTGAAILRYLWTKLGEPVQHTLRPMQLDRIGTGFGSRVLAGISNVLRVMVFHGTSETRVNEMVGVISFEIDDQTAEDLALAVDALREHEGVLEVLQIPVLGKKGRMAVQVQVVCREDVLNAVIDACFRQTTTLGLRWSVTARATLMREIIEDTGNPSVTVKVAVRPGGRATAKCDVEAVRDLPGHNERVTRRQAAEQRVLQNLASKAPCRSK